MFGWTGDGWGSSGSWSSLLTLDRYCPLILARYRFRFTFRSQWGRIGLGWVE